MKTFTTSFSYLQNRLGNPVEYASLTKYNNTTSKYVFILCKMIDSIVILEILDLEEDCVTCNINIITYFYITAENKKEQIFNNLLNSLFQGALLSELPRFI